MSMSIANYFSKLDTTEVQFFSENLEIHREKDRLESLDYKTRSLHCQNVSVFRQSFIYIHMNALTTKTFVEV